CPSRSCRRRARTAAAPEDCPFPGAMPPSSRGRASTSPSCARRDSRALRDSRESCRSGRRPPRGCWLTAHVTQQLANGLFELPPVNYAVDHAVLEQELRGLEALRQILPERLLDHTRAGEANHRA